jgi:glycogen(starch) synthase
MNSSRRVLFWTDTFWPNIGGVEILAARFLPALQRRGYEFLVIVPQGGPDRPEEDTYGGIPVYRLPFSLGMTSIDELTRVREQVIRIKRSFQPHLIHINAVGPANFFHHLTTNAHAAPLLVTLHGAWGDKVNSLVERTLRGADWVVGCSAAILSQGRGLAPEIASRSSVIHNGLEVPAHAPTPLPAESPRLLCIGRLHVKKGIDVALAAFESILERFPKSRLIIAGDGPARAELERQASARELDGAVDFLGWVSPQEVPDLINTCTVVLMPSRAESLPLVALQAALMARPVVGTRVGGLAEAVVHEATGLLVESENSAALADAAEFMLANPVIATRMGQAARRRAQIEFSWHRHVQAYDRLYRRLIEAGASPRQDFSELIAGT